MWPFNKSSVDDKSVAFIGVGKLGQPVAESMSKHYDVIGYDIQPVDSEIPMAQTMRKAVHGRKFIFIAVQTPHDPKYGGEKPIAHLKPKDFDYSTVKKVLREVNKHVTEDQMVVLISTVLPGTVRKHLRPEITNARFIYNPYLIAMGTVAWDFANPEMVIIGTEDGSIDTDAKELIDFYKPLMQNDPRYEVGTWDEAEAIKVFYNTFISAKLGIVNMIQDVAEANGNMNVDVVTKALADSTYRITGPAYLTAGMGDGGPCHPRDNIALRFMSEQLGLGYDLFDAIMVSREKQAKTLAAACLRKGDTVMIVGKAYKPGVPYTDGSYSLLVGHYVKQGGGNVVYYDPNTNDTDHPEVDVYMIGYWEEWVEQFDFRHDNIVDPWRKYEPKTENVQHYGDSR